MTARRLIILGATGDLTGRYLLVALAELGAKGGLPDDLVIVGVGQERWDEDRFRRHAAQRLTQHAQAALDEMVERSGRRHIAAPSVAGSEASPATYRAASP